MDKSSNITSVDVCIVGAGLAGLSAARHILDNDHTGRVTVTIVEARDRAGGRTNSVPSQKVDDAMVDIGGQWFGPTQKRMLKYISEFGLQLIEQEYNVDTEVCCSDSEDEVKGGQSLIEFANVSFKPLAAEVADEIDSFKTLVNDAVTRMDPRAPWDFDKAAEYDALTVENFVLNVIKTEGARKEIFMFVRALMACDPCDCSFLFFLFFLCSGGGMEALGDGPEGAQKWFVKGGSQQISNRLLSLLSSKPNFSSYFNLAVSSIQRVLDEHGELSYLVSGGNSYDTRVVHCKHVIVSMAPVMAAKYINFYPQLPEKKLQICKEMVMSRCVKVIVSYPNAFWEGQTYEFSETFGANADKTDVGFIHNLFKGYMGKYPALIGLIGGQYADQFSAMTPEERKEAVFLQFSKMYCADLQLTSSPIEYIEKNWCQEQYSAGCFSGVFPPKVLTSCREEIRSPVGQIHWAGTETSTCFYGFMEGASESGERAAKEVLDMMKTKTQNKVNAEIASSLEQLRLFSTRSRL